MAKATKSNRLTMALLAAAEDMRDGEILNGTAYSKITMRHFEDGRAPSEPLTGEDIRTLRTQAHMSQAVFAQLLNVTTGYVSQLERGVKRPTGAAFVLLDVIRRKGIKAIL